MDIEAVLFDMDGVLVDSEPLHFASTNDVLGRRGARLPAADYLACTGMGEVEFFSLLVERFCLDDAPGKLADERVALSLERMARLPLPPLNGALECLLMLQGDGRKLALASSARRIQVELVVNRLGVKAIFGALVSGDDVERAKPAPDLFEEAARRLGCEAEACVVVEDAVHGIAAARAAGMLALGVAADPERGMALGAAGAVRVLTSLSELTPELLETLAREAGSSAPGA